MSTCNVPPPRGRARLHLAAFQDIDCPHRPTPVFSAHFVVTRAHPGRTSRSVTHPQISLGQARLTSEFFGDQLPEKKLQLVGMSILLILLSSELGCHMPSTCVTSIPDFRYYSTKAFGMEASNPAATAASPWPHTPPSDSLKTSNSVNNHLQLLSLF